MGDYIRINQEQYDKAKFHFRSQVGAVLNCFRCYGMGDDVDIAIGEVVILAEQFAMVVRGKSIPIKVREEPKRRPTE